ncbi:MAG: LysR family transcriptional regulator [Gemmatimonadota bacterium]
MIDLTALETFQTIVEARGFGRAAERLSLTQPAVSYRIRRLESELGAPLFESPRRRLILTEAGERLYAFCTKLSTDVDSLRERISGPPTDASPLRVCCPGAFGRSVVFPALAAEPLRDQPIRLVFRSLDEILDAVERGEADLGIAYATRVTRPLDFRLVTDEEFCLVAPRGGGPSAPTRLEDLSSLTFVTYEECDYVFGKWFQDVFGGSPPRIRSRWSFSRVDEVVESVALGRGVSIVPRHSIGAEALGWVEIVRPPGRPRCLNPEYAVTRPGWTEHPAVDRFLDAVAKEAEQYLG